MSINGLPSDIVNYASRMKCSCHIRIRIPNAGDVQRSGKGLTNNRFVAAMMVIGTHLSDNVQMHANASRGLHTQIQVCNEWTVNLPVTREILVSTWLNNNHVGSFKRFSLYAQQHYREA